MLKVQVAAKGMPAQPSDRASWNDLTEARVSWTVRCCLVCTLMLAGFAVRVKWAAVVMVTDAAGEVEVA